jgi:hypothetical protein
MTPKLPKKLQGSILLSILFLSISISSTAQFTEYFESFTSGATSFTSNAQPFTLTGGIQVSVLASTGVDNHTPASTAGSSNQYIDNFNAVGTNKPFSIKTTNSATFTVKSLYFYVSNDPSASHGVTTSGSITFTGKKSGATQFTKTYNSASFTFPSSYTTYQGFTYLDFSAAGYSLIDIDELDIIEPTTFIYVAIDNFQFGAPIVLPIGLANFTANKQENNIALNWQLAQENNIDSFAVEHSMNGKNWEVINTITSTGNSSKAASYSYVDNAPVYGENYYCIKQINNDGTVEYSKVIPIDWDASTSSIDIYPNPATGFFITDLHQNVTTPVYYEVINTLGATVQQGYITTNKQTINIANLPKGIYFLKAAQQIVKFIKQ